MTEAVAVADARCALMNAEVGSKDVAALGGGVTITLQPPSAAASSSSPAPPSASAPFSATAAKGGSMAVEALEVVGRVWAESLPLLPIWAPSSGTGAPSLETLEQDLGLQGGGGAEGSQGVGAQGMEGVQGPGAVGPGVEVQSWWEATLQAQWAVLQTQDAKAALGQRPGLVSV